jgi:hypothetical protein
MRIIVVMKAIKTCLFLLLVFFASCEKSDPKVPECINNIINEHGTDLFICDSGGSVKQFLFQGDYVYVFDPGNCGADLMASVYNSKCQSIGGLGGFAGNVIINGERFDQKGKYIKTIWEN